MDVKEKIDYMINSLKIAKEEIEYAEKYKAEPPNRYYDKRRNPNGTLIRENLKSVSRMSSIVAKDVILTPYCNDITK